VRSYFADYMAQDRGMGVPAATSMVIVFGAGSVVGSLVGGAGGQWLYNRTPGALGALMGGTTALGALPLLYVVNSPALAGASGMAFLGGVLSCVTGALPAAAAAHAHAACGVRCAGRMRRRNRPAVHTRTRTHRCALHATFHSLHVCAQQLCAPHTGTNVRAVLIGVNAPETRGTVFAIFNLMDGLGKGLGPAAVASLIESHGRLYAFNVSLSMWLLCGALLACIALTLGADERALQLRLARARNAAQADGEEHEEEAAVGGGGDGRGGGGGGEGALELQRLRGAESAPA
jgi:hypothetical protein